MTTSKIAPISRPTPEEAVIAVTREIPNYIDRVEEESGGPASELWGLVLATSGKMRFSVSDAADDHMLGVPNHDLGYGRTRYDLWRTAIMTVLRILGDPESRYRTGFESATLIDGIEKFFER